MPDQAERAHDLWIAIPDLLPTQYSVHRESNCTVHDPHQGIRPPAHIGYTVNGGSQESWRLRSPPEIFNGRRSSDERQPVPRETLLLGAETVDSKLANFKMQASQVGLGIACSTPWGAKKDAFLLIHEIV